VIALDRENYEWAMVAGPTRDYLWILARQPRLDPQIQAALVEQAAEAGFKTEELIFVSHKSRK
jgi:apolipoprotein D and lipocalin family protein